MTDSSQSRFRLPQWRWVLLAVFGAGCTYDVGAPTVEKTVAQEKDAAVVTINLGASSDDLRTVRDGGIAVDREGERTMLVAPGRVSVRSGGQDVLSTDAKLVTVRHPHGTVEEVTITFPLETVTFAQAIEAMRVLLASIPGVSTDQIDEMLNRWIAEGTPESVFDEKSGRIISDRGIRAYCEIQYHQNSGRCFCSVEIAR